jgi:hypothetical protein
MADHHYGLATSGHGARQDLGRRARRETLVGRRLDAELTADEASRLARTEQWAREDGVRLDARLA